MIGAADLDAGLLERWEAVLRDDCRLASPFFRPEFFRAVGDARADVRIGVISEAGRPYAFFPYQQPRGAAAAPVGAGLADYHGVIGEPRLPARALLRSIGLDSFTFEGVPAWQSMFQPFQQSTRYSPLLDLSSGFAQYAGERRAAGSGQVDDAARQGQRLERELGPLRFEAHVAAPAALARLLAWKSAQYRRTGALDIFAFRWVVDTVERVHATQAPAFAGLLSYLFAGDTPVAAHLGLRSQSVWHYWLPAYALEHARFSPGIVLLLEMARHAGDLGLDILDLGRGDALYKRRLMNGSTELAEGAIAATSRAAAELRLRRATGRLAARTPAASYLGRRSARRRFR